MARPKTKTSRKKTRPPAKKTAKPPKKAVKPQQRTGPAKRKAASKATKGGTTPKPVAITFAAIDVAPWEIAETSEPAFDVVFSGETMKLRPLAQPLHVLEGHTAFVQAMAFAPDGKLLVTGSEDGTVRVWDVGAPEVPCVKTLAEHGSAVNFLQFTPDGNQLLTCSDDQTAKVWSLPAFEVTQTLEGHTDYVSKIFPAGRGRCVTSSKDGTVRTWNTATGEQLRAMDHGGWVFAAGASHDGTRLVASSDHNVMRMWNLDTGEVERVLVDAGGTYIGEVMGLTMAATNKSGRGHASYPAKVAYAPDDKTFISSEKEVIEWDAATGEELGRSEGDGWPLNGIAYIKDRATMLGEHGSAMERDFIARLAASPDDKEVRTVYGDWLEDQGRVVEANTVRRHGAFRYIFTGSHDAVHVIDLGMRTIVAQAAWEHGGDVHNVCVSDDGRLAASGSADGVVGLWDVDALLRAGLADRHLGAPRNVAISAAGIALTNTSDRMTRLWTPTGASNEKLAPTPGQFANVRFTPDGARALVMADEGVLQIYDGVSGAPLGSATYSDDTDYKPFSEVAFLADGSMLVGSVSGPLAIWNISEPNTPPIKFTGEAGQVTAMAVDEAANLVVTGMYRSGTGSKREPMKLLMWDLAKRALVRELQFKAPGDQYICSITLVPASETGGDRRIVISTSAGGIAFLDHGGKVLRAYQIGDEYLNSALALGDAKVVIGNSKPTLVDAREMTIVSQWAREATYSHFIPNTARAIVTEAGGLRVVDFASNTLSAATRVGCENTAAASPDGRFVVATSSVEAVAGVPIVLRARE